MANNGLCGLLVQGSNARIPLKTASYDVEICSFASRIKINQTYVNKEQTDLECVYTFPIHDQASVIGFQVTIDGRILTSQFKKKDDAFQEYNDALAKGHGAYLLDRSDDRDDTFVMSVGRLPPGKECIVAISYVCTLESVDQTNLRLTIPLAIIPRCIDITPSQQMPLELNPSLPSSVICQLNARIEMYEEIKSIISPTHPVHVDILEAKQANVTFETEQLLDRDFILNIEVKSNPEHYIEVEEYAPNKFAAMYTFVPSIPPVAKDFVYELVFLVDCSISMSGTNIAHARTAMQLFLCSLPKDCLFNFYKFGSGYVLHYQENTYSRRGTFALIVSTANNYHPKFSGSRKIKLPIILVRFRRLSGLLPQKYGDGIRFTSLFPDSVAYDEESFKVAKNYVTAVQADMGGTELYEPLRGIFSKPVNGSRRIVFVLTDGGVGNPAGVVKLVRHNAEKNRVFSFGIGCHTSSDLVNGLARAGNGKAEFISDGRDFSDQVCRHLRGALQPAISGAVVSLEGSVRKLQLIPAELPVIFAGEHAMVFALFQVITFPITTSNVSFVFKTETTTIQTVIPLKNTRKSASCFISKLAARAIVKELESQPNPDPATITKLSLKFGLVSKYVSLIALETRENVEPGHMELREIPVDQASAKSFDQSTNTATEGLDCGNIHQATSMLENLRALSLDFSGEISPKSVSSNNGFVAENRRSDLLRTKATFKSKIRDWRYQAQDKMFGALCSIAGAADELIYFKKYRDERAQMVRTKEIETQGPGPGWRARHDEPDELGGAEQNDHDQGTGSSTNGSNRAEGVSENATVGSLRSILLLQNWDGSWTLDCDLQRQMPELGNILKNLEDVLTGYNVLEAVLVTAIIVAVIEGRFKEQVNTWSAIVAKAKDYISEQTGIDVMGKIMEQARSLSIA